MYLNYARIRYCIFEYFIVAATQAKVCNKTTEFDCDGDGRNCIGNHLVCNSVNDCGSFQDEDTAGVCSKYQKYIPDRVGMVQWLVCLLCDKL